MFIDLRNGNFFQLQGIRRSVPVDLYGFHVRSDREGLTKSDQGEGRLTIWESEELTEFGFIIISNNITGLQDQFHLFLDAAAVYSFGKIRHLLVPGGRYVTTLPSASQVFWENWYKLNGKKRVSGIWVKMNPPDLNYLTELVDSGRLRTHLDNSFTLDTIADAHSRSETGRVVGKIAINIRTE